ncbi:hypothetical protein L204_101026 [Cryptococcus depauperatus]
MTTTSQSPWQRRMRRLFLFIGTASTFYLLSTYVAERLRESRLKAIREKKQRELLKNHFTSLISQISFTVYALLPTLYPQVFEAYPVESTSQTIQEFSTLAPLMNESISSVDSSNSDNSLHLQAQRKEKMLDQSIASSTETDENDSGSTKNHDGTNLEAQHALGIGESWASEFHKGNGEDPETESGIISASSETEDGLSSIVSQSISLPPTDSSSNFASPRSDLSQPDHPNPSSPSIGRVYSSPPAMNKSKRELWKDLKAQSIARTLTTVYILPMLYLLTSSQLAVIARNAYLNDLRKSYNEGMNTNPLGSKNEDDDEDGFCTPRHNASEATLTGLSMDTATAKKKKNSWLSSFSVDSMGLSEFVESGTSILPNPVNYLPKQITTYLPSFLASHKTNQAQRMGEVNILQIEAQRRAEEEAAEILFLSYSWWILNEGWKVLAARVDEVVDKFFGSMALKKELTLYDWELLFKEVRAEIEVEIPSSGIESKHAFFLTVMLPLSPVTNLRTPFPRQPLDHSSHLASMFNETLTHLSSPDANYLLEKGVSSLMQNLLTSLKERCFTSVGLQPTRRLVDCLPAISHWGKAVWKNVPDTGVEDMLAIPEFEGFSALIFGDWAPR